jgi:hypothetical protein
MTTRTQECRRCKQPTHRLSRVCTECLRRERARVTRQRITGFDTPGSFARACVDKSDPHGAITLIRWLEANEEYWVEIDAGHVNILNRCRSQRVSPLWWMLQVARQNAQCAICDTPTHPLKLNIDHDHVTGKVRGLLCTACNSGLGLLGIDGPIASQRIRDVIRYFDRNGYPLRGT